MYYKDSQTGQIFRVNGNTNQIEVVSSVPAGTSLSQGQTMSQIANAYGVSLPGGATPTANAPYNPFDPSRNIAYGATNTQPVQDYSVNYDSSDLGSMQNALSALEKNAKTTADYQKLQQLRDAVSAETTRQNNLKTQAQQIASGGGGTTAINNFYSSLSAKDQALVKGYFGNNLISGYTAPSSNNIKSTITSNGVTSSETAPDLSGLPPQFSDLYGQLETYLQKLQANGQVLNPNITIDPATTASFLSQAHSEIDPYYSGQLKLATDALSKSIQYAQGTEANTEANAGTTYAKDLRTLQGNFADNGMAQSGARNTGEADLAKTTQNSIDEARRTLSYNAGNAASTFAQKYGGSNLPTFNAPASPRVLPGELKFDTSGGSSPLYTLSPDVYNGLTGSEQYQQRADVSNRASQLESAFRTNQGISQARSLTL